MVRGLELRRRVSDVPSGKRTVEYEVIDFEHTAWFRESYFIILFDI